MGVSERRLGRLRSAFFTLWRAVRRRRRHFVAGDGWVAWIWRWRWCLVLDGRVVAPREGEAVRGGSGAWRFICLAAKHVMDFERGV